MIPLHKLAKLPRSQKLRKAARLFAEAEQRLISLGRLAEGETEYLGSAAELLAADKGFSGAVLDALKDAKTNISSGSEIRRALNNIHHILLAETGQYQADWDFIEASGALDPSKRRPFPGMQVYLEDIRSPFNVGSLFRTAESFGAEMLWLSALCADPRHKRALRSAMGCVDILPWERLSQDPFVEAIAGGASEVKAPEEFIDGPFFTLETGGTPLAYFQFPARGILIVGSEELGVSPCALAAADASLGRVSIPSRGAKASLNVSVAFGIVMQAWAERLAI